MRRQWSTVFTVVVGLAAILAIEGPAAAGGNADDIDKLPSAADMGNGAVNLWKGWAASTAGARPRSGSRPAAEPQPVPTYQNRLICFDGQGGERPAPQGGWCQSGIPTTGAVECDEAPVEPTWRQLTYPDGRVGPWERLDEGSCGPVLPVLTVEDFRSLPIPAPALRLQPDRGWVLVNIETIVMTDPTPVPLRTTLGGFGIDVEAMPRSFTYDFGDGHRLVTRSPGRAHPDHDTFHEYEAPGTYAITLTAEWAGRYRVDGDPTWREVTGTATTSTTSAPFTAEERTSRLVADLCTDRPQPPDC